jgi:hypothetical protein
VNYAKLLEMNSFFTLHSFLEVGKTQDLTSKFWQTLGDAAGIDSAPSWSVVVLCAQDLVGDVLLLSFSLSSLFQDFLVVKKLVWGRQDHHRTH